MIDENKCRVCIFLYFLKFFDMTWEELLYLSCEFRAFSVSMLLAPFQAISNDDADALGAQACSQCTVYPSSIILADRKVITVETLCCSSIRADLVSRQLFMLHDAKEFAKAYHSDALFKHMVDWWRDQLIAAARRGEIIIPLKPSAPKL